jgi:hypothetical protein
MAVFGTGNPTLLDQIKRTDPDGKVAKITEALTERNPILMDMTFQEGNLETGHRLTIRSGLPTVGWRKFNEGVAKSKSTTIQVDETCGMLEGRSVVDCKLAKLNGNEAAFRASEDRAFLQSLNIEVANAVFYSNTKVDPEKIHGLTPRFDSLSGGNQDNVVNFADYATGAVAGNDQYSMWFITWGPDTCYGIYPKGSQVGISSEDLGKEYEEDPNDATKKFLAWRTHWNWDLGLCIKDWRYIVRICNLDSSALPSEVTDGSWGLIAAMVDAYNRIFDFNAGRTVCYCNRQVLTWLDLQVIGKSNMYFYPVEWHGRKINSFRGIPIVTCDALRNTETIVA